MSTKSNSYRVTIEAIDEDGVVIESTMRLRSPDSDRHPWWAVLGEAAGSALSAMVPSRMWDSVMADLCSTRLLDEEPSVFCALSAAWVDSRDSWDFKQACEVAENIRIVVTPPFDEVTDYSALLVDPAWAFVTVADVLPESEESRYKRLREDDWQEWVEALPRTKRPEIESPP